MILYINTIDQKRVSVGLKEKTKFIDKLTEQNEYGSQVLLPLIEQILKRNDLNYKDLSEVEVETGSGSFTGIRVGVSVANALGFGLNIPVNTKEMEVDLVY